MRIGIYGRGLANRAGIGRYTRNLLRAMVAEPRGHEILIYGGAPTEDPLLSPYSVRLEGPGNRLVEEQGVLPRATRRHRLDIFFNPDFTLPLVSTGARAEIVTVHDAAYRRFPDSNGLRSRLLLNALMPSTLCRADAVIANSAFTKGEFVDLYRVPEEKVHPIHLGLETTFHPRPTPSLNRTVLAVGTIEPRKNLVALAQAVRNVEANLMLVGGVANRGAEISAEIRAILGDRVQFLGPLSDEALLNLYSSTTVVAYPSLYEGFGFPPLEAMACGTPAIAAHRASLPEVGGDAIAYFEPDDPSSLESVLRRVLDDPDYRQTLAGRGLHRAKSFTWEKTARETWQVIEALAT